MKTSSAAKILKVKNSTAKMILKKLKSDGEEGYKTLSFKEEKEEI